MELQVGVKLSKEQVFNLLTRFDDSSDIPLHEGLDFDSYSNKLSQYAYFILAYKDEKCIGFITYYLNEEGNFIYVPQVVVHKLERHQGVGHQMFNALCSQYAKQYNTIKLEVLKENQNARFFYARESFGIIENRGQRLLLERKL